MFTTGRINRPLVFQPNALCGNDAAVFTDPSTQSDGHNVHRNMSKAARVDAGDES